MAASVIAGLKNWKLLRPFSFAWYMAVSAFFISVSTSSPLAGKKADADARCRMQLFAFDLVGVAQCRHDLFRDECCVHVVGETRQRDHELVAAGRATISLSRTHADSRLATSISNRSPTWWPRVSLMTLNRSRSMKITASCWFSRRAASSDWATGFRGYSD